MKFKTEFENLKDALLKVGKAARKTSAETPVVQLDAKGDTLTLSAEGTLGIRAVIPAEVAEPGVFTASLSSINILTVRNCTGTLSAKSIGDNALLLKYKGAQASTTLTRCNGHVPDEEELAAGDVAKYVELPADKLKSACEDTMWIAPADVEHIRHMVEVAVEDDVEGVMKLSVSAVDSPGFAIRNEYLAKNGTYTGKVTLMPSQVKAALSILDGKAPIRFAVTGNHVYMSQKGAMVSLARPEKSLPASIQKMAGTRNSTFSIQAGKKEMLDALACIKYLQAEKKASGEEPDMLLSFSDGEITVGCVGITDFAEKIAAKAEGAYPDNVPFATQLLSDTIARYPGEDVTIAGTADNQPFWVCAGEHDEYVYCILPKIKKR